MYFPEAHAVHKFAWGPAGDLAVQQIGACPLLVGPPPTGAFALNNTFLLHTEQPVW
jgi:hypothetical protein